MITLTNPCQFLSVVQELTGKDATIVLDNDIGEATKVPKREISNDLKMDSDEDSTHDGFSNSSSSLSGEIDQDTVFWSNIYSESSFFEFQFDSVLA
ncbi:hypothetical protein M5689_024556 [Euphorbia peplus]|nr:hypothetical protein M5689_024556 [Euphorbia peplus]